MDIGKPTPERGEYPYCDKVRACARQSTYDWWDIVRTRAYQ